MRMITVEFENGHAITCDAGTTAAELLETYRADLKISAPVLGALANNEMVRLDYPLPADVRLKFLTDSDPGGRQIYRSTLSFLLSLTVHRLFPAAEFAVEHSLGKGYFCSFSINGDRGISDEQLAAIEHELSELTTQDLLIEWRKISFRQAVEHFEKKGQRDKMELLRYRNPARVAIYECASYMDLAHAPLALRTGAVACYQLVRYENGFVLRFPGRDPSCRFRPFEPAPHLFQIFREHKEWGRVVGVRTAGDLNRKIATHEWNNFVDICEAFQEKRIVRIADAIARKRKQIRWVFVAGPSSSGKTTFSKRLAIQLQANGIRTHAVSMDDYFVERALTPKDEFGEHDYEHLDAVDLALLDRHLAELDASGEVELPVFNFETGQREFHGRKLKMNHDEVVIMEGIHGLNPRVRQVIPDSHIFKIYVSALTQLNLDSGNRVSTTDNRLLRRIVRDNMYRNHCAETTLELWGKVRRGEKRWIFAHQSAADAAFNSALDYELAVLKPYAEPLLAEIKPECGLYSEARRLQNFLENFLVAPADRIPPNSILREFIGKSSLR